MCSIRTRARVATVRTSWALSADLGTSRRTLEALGLRDEPTEADPGPPAGRLRGGGWPGPQLSAGDRNARRLGESARRRSAIAIALARGPAPLRILDGPPRDAGPADQSRRARGFGTERATP